MSYARYRRRLLRKLRRPSLSAWEEQCLREMYEWGDDLRTALYVMTDHEWTGD